jgi:hypothetical protein
MSTPEEQPIVGLKEIGPLLEVDGRTPHAWHYRKLLPVPDYASINGIRAWDRQTIVDWAAETGRLPESLRAEANTDVTIPRGGKKAKAENIAALTGAGLIAVNIDENVRFSL